MALARLVERWDELLASLGGDPARHDWRSFRPLRLSREEDWSDWLAHLLEGERAGRFAALLFAEDPSDPERWMVAACRREVPAEGYRADLVVRFANAEWAVVEVKVGDLQLRKTLATGAAVRAHQSGRCRGEFLLLPEADVAVWMAERASDPGGREQVIVRTWRDVARSLRLSVVDPATESTTWRVWAWTFLGAVEQQLLGFPQVPKRASGGRPPTIEDLARLDYMESLEASS